MELRQIYYFLVLAEEKNFSRAAKRVYISQPSLSRHIGTLEGELGFPLFHRGGKDLELTGAGKELLPLAKELESSMEVFRNEAERIRTKGPDILRIGYEKETEFLIPRIVRAFSERFPEGHLELSIQKSDELTRLLCRREISAAIRYFTPEKEDEAVLPPFLRNRTLLYKDRAVIFGSPSPSRYADLYGGSFECTLPEFLDFTFLVSSKEQEKFLTGIFQRHFLPLPKIQHCPDMDTLRIYLKSGLGVSLLPEGALTERKEELPRWIIRDVPEALSVESVWYSDDLDPGSRRIYDVLKEIGRNKDTVLTA